MITNFIIAYKIFDLSAVYSCMTSFTAILTPSLYPTDTAVHISLLGRFHILNSVSTTAVIVFAAFTTNSYTQADLVWTPTDNVSLNITAPDNSSDLVITQTVFNTTLSDNLPQFNISVPLSCPPVPSTTPLLLTHGVLPPILVASLVYILIVVVIMGLIRPAFLELQPSQYYRSRHNSMRKFPMIEETDKCELNEESEETLSLNKDKRKSDIRFDVDYIEFLDGKETQL